MSSFFLSASDPILLVGQSGGGSGGIVGLLFPLALIIGVFYFFIYRPQQKREEEHQEMVENLEQGDKVVTVGGIYGTVQKIDEESVLTQVDSKGTRLRIEKDSIASLSSEEE